MFLSLKIPGPNLRFILCMIVRLNNMNNNDGDGRLTEVNKLAWKFIQILKHQLWLLNQRITKKKHTKGVYDLTLRELTGWRETCRPEGLILSLRGSHRKYIVNTYSPLLLFFYNLGPDLKAAQNNSDSKLFLLMHSYQGR